MAGLMSPINFLGSHFRPWFPFFLLLGSLCPVSKSVECRDLAGRRFHFCWYHLFGCSPPLLDTLLDSSTHRIIHQRWTGELLQDLDGSLHHTFGEAAHQIWSREHSCLFRQSLHPGHYSMGFRSTSTHT